MRRPITLAIVGVLVLAAACAPPIAVRRDIRGAQRLAASSVLTSGEVSRRSRNLLYARDLLEAWAEDRPGALATLHDDFVHGRLLPEDAALLSELSFYHGQHGGGSPYFLASALYAWRYLFLDDPHATPDRFDRRVMVVSELYNRGLARGLAKGDRVDLRPGSYPLPFVTLEVSMAPETLRWGDHQLYDFFPAAELEVKGFETYYKWPGLGAPLAARVTPTPDGDRDLLAPKIRVPVAALLRPADLSHDLGAGTVRAALEVYPGYGERKVRIDHEDVPLEAEPTATIALALAETAGWQRETRGLIHGAGVIEERARLVSSRPYRPGLIPVVFVHGTGSSLVRWSEIYNELDNDPRIHDRFQFWFFSYETGNPFLYSAMNLREALTRAVAQLDPNGKDPALAEMVVIGHSQGGLLTKCTVVESGDAFWHNLSPRPLAQLDVSPETRDLLQRAMFLHPLPFVRRVVFVSTPHHGSYIAGSWLAHQFARLIKAPFDLTRRLTEVMTLNKAALAAEGIRGAPTAVDNMTPGNRFVKVLATLPIAPDVVAHSIISVDAAGPPWQGKNDGVVEYDSAHIDGVESELVVRSPHSCQSNPHTINEVRRILLEHLQTLQPRAAAQS